MNDPLGELVIDGLLVSSFSTKATCAMFQGEKREIDHGYVGVDVVDTRDVCSK